MIPPRPLLVMAALALSATTSAAEPRYNPRTLTCEAVRDVIRSHGAVTLRYMSTRVPGLPLYDRYVRDTRFCDAGEVARAASVPSKDRKNCPVKVCRKFDPEEDLFFWPRPR